MSQVLAVTLSLGFGSVQLWANANGMTVAELGPTQQVRDWQQPCKLAARELTLSGSHGYRDRCNAQFARRRTLTSASARQLTCRQAIVVCG